MWTVLALVALLATGAQADERTTTFRTPEQVQEEARAAARRRHQHEAADADLYLRRLYQDELLGAIREHNEDGEDHDE